MGSDMESTVIGIWAAVLVQLCGIGANAQAGEIPANCVLRIHLPREIRIEQEYLKLGQVSVICGDEALAAKASEIAMGRISVPGQKIVVDRRTILSRLACNGIGASQVKMTGASQVTVSRRQQIVTGRELVELASSLLRNALPAGAACQPEPVRTPSDMFLPGRNRDIQLSPRICKGSARNLAKVQIAAVEKGKQIAVREVLLRLKYKRRAAVTLVDIPAGTPITPENVRIEMRLLDEPEPSNWRPPYGLVAKRRLAAKTVIGHDMLVPPKSPVVVKRNQNVVIRVERPGLSITAAGKAMQDARAGECIKVRNLDSQRIITAKANEDGSVEPVF